MRPPRGGGARGRGRDGGRGGGRGRGRGGMVEPTPDYVVGM